MSKQVWKVGELDNKTYIVEWQILDSRASLAKNNVDLVHFQTLFEKADHSARQGARREAESSEFMDKNVSSCTTNT